MIGSTTLGASGFSDELKLPYGLWPMDWDLLGLAIRLVLGSNSWRFDVGLKAVGSLNPTWTLS